MPRSSLRPRTRHTAYYNIVLKGPDQAFGVGITTLVNRPYVFSFTRSDGNTAEGSEAINQLVIDRLGEVLRISSYCPWRPGNKIEVCFDRITDLETAAKVVAMFVQDHDQRYD